MIDRAPYVIILAACLWAGCTQHSARTAQVETYIMPRSTIYTTSIDRGMDGMTFEPRTIWEPYEMRSYPMDSIADSVEYISFRSFTLDTAYVNQMFGDLQPFHDPYNAYVPTAALIHVIWEDHTDTFRISKAWVLHDHEKRFVVNPALRNYLLSIMPEGMRQDWEGDSYAFYDPNLTITLISPEEADSVAEARRREMRRLGKSEAEINASIFDPEWFARHIDSMSNLFAEPTSEPAPKR
jgi:hypothetical protein